MEQQSTSMTDAAQNQELEMAEALGFPSIGAMQKHFAEAEQPMHATSAYKVELPFFTHNVGFLEVNAPDGLSIYGNDWKGFCVDGSDVQKIWYFGQTDGERSFSPLQAKTPALAVIEAIQKNLIGVHELSGLAAADYGNLWATLLNGQLRFHASLVKLSPGSDSAHCEIALNLSLNIDGKEHRVGSAIIYADVINDEYLSDFLYDSFYEGRLLRHLIPSDALLFDTDSPVVADLSEDQFHEWLSTELQHHGWQLASGIAIASKSFETAVGTKEAYLYLHPHKVPPSYSLHGDYQSEGRNVLSSSFLPVKMDASLDSLSDTVAQHIAKLEEQIQASFAARLYLQRDISL